VRRFLILVAVAALAALQSSSVVAETGSPGIGASIPIRAGVHTYVHSVALNPAFCAKLEAAVPNMRGQPCLGTITVRVTSGAAVKGRTLTTNTALAPVEVYAEFCGVALYFCFHVDAYWGVVYKAYTWVQWGPWCDGYSIGGSYSINWCGSYHNFWYTSQAGINVQLNYPWASWGAGMRVNFPANYAIWVSCWGNGGGPCG